MKFISYSWRDLVLLLLFLRIAYISTSNGILSEIIKFSVLLVSSMAAFHFYPRAVSVLSEKLPFIDSGIFPPLAFLIFFLAVFLIFSLIGRIILPIIKKENRNFFDRWSALIIGICRLGLLISILSFVVFHLPCEDCFVKYQRSFSHRLSRNIAPAAYLLIANTARNRLNMDVNINEEVIYYYETGKNL